MKRHRFTIYIVLGGAFVLSSGIPLADGQLRWSPRKEAIEVRLIALAVAYPRSSYFANDEVFVAEQELAKEESRFIKLVYDFLPYQSPLSVNGLDYSLVHVVHAVCDTTCDESLWQMRSLSSRQQRNLPHAMKACGRCVRCPVGNNVMCRSMPHGSTLWTRPSGTSISARPACVVTGLPRTTTTRPCANPPTKSLISRD